MMMILPIKLLQLGGPKFFMLNFKEFVEGMWIDRHFRIRYKSLLLDSVLLTKGSHHVFIDLIWGAITHIKEV